MYKYSLLSLLTLSFQLFFSIASAQSSDLVDLPQANKVGWYFSPSYSPMFHNDHIGNAVGAEIGASFLKRHLQVGFFYLGRSGPINPQEYIYSLPTGEDYKGKTELSVGADHAAFGLAITPIIPLAGKKLNLEIPLVFGQLGAGFYLKGEDRITPDDRRVSEWENELMNNMDAGFGLMLDGGIRVSTPIAKSGGIIGGLGFHYTQTFGWETTVGGRDFFDIPRMSFFLRFGN